MSVEQKPEEKTKICPKCREEVKWRAKICPHCRKKVPMKWAEYTKFEKITGVTLAAVIFFVVFSAMLSPDDPQAVVEKEKDSSDYQKKVVALVCAEQEVEKNLKSPGSAKFPSVYTPDLPVESDGSIIIKSYVDSENGFGALLRTLFSCTVNVTDPVKGDCTVKCDFITQ